MEYRTILFEKIENYAIITLNRPDKLNALNEELFSELNSIITTIELDSTIKAVIMTGSGEKAFAAGADIVELNKSNDRSGKLFSEYGSKVMLRLELLKVPVIAAINGFALGGGCELAMACHIRICSENAKFGQPEVNLGIIPGYGGTQRMNRIIGKSMAMELILSANIINADEALRIGLVNHIYPLNELIPQAKQLVNLILSKGSLAVSAAIDCINMAEHLSPIEGLNYESSKFGQICGTNDFIEGTNAFLEKRKPVFQGK